jgi:hypothetical protein
MPGDVSLPMAISADKPLLVKAVGMLRNAWEVYCFIGGRLLGQQQNPTVKPSNQRYLYFVANHRTTIKR